MENFFFIPQIGDWFRKVGKLFKGITDQDEREYLKLFTKGPGKGTGQNKN